ISSFALASLFVKLHEAGLISLLALVFPFSKFHVDDQISLLALVFPFSKFHAGDQISSLVLALLVLFLVFLCVFPLESHISTPSIPCRETPLLQVWELKMRKIGSNPSHAAF